jgi:hypothetical protein
MRYSTILYAAILLLASGAKAQVSTANSFALASPGAEAEATAAPNTPLTLTSPTLFALAPVTPAPSPVFPMAAPAAIPAPDPQGVQGVFENYSWEAYVGYTFLRFYEVPGVQENQNGFNFSMAWYYRDWIAVEGEMMAAHGDIAGVSSWSLFGGGGPRLCWDAPRGLVVFGHALLGGAHLTPQTAYGTEGAFAYEVGGGVDLTARHKRWALRLEGDMLGTRYFSTYQYSPKVSAGIVFKF